MNELVLFCCVSLRLVVGVGLVGFIVKFVVVFVMADNR